jgi:hypothetical protein
LRREALLCSSFPPYAFVLLRRLIA